MTRECKGRCEARPRAKWAGNRLGGGPRVCVPYGDGGAYCSTCRAAWRKYEGMHCPCCGVRVRRRARGRGGVRGALSR